MIPNPFRVAKITDSETHRAVVLFAGSAEAQNVSVLCFDIPSGAPGYDDYQVGDEFYIALTRTMKLVRQTSFPKPDQSSAQGMEHAP